MMEPRQSHDMSYVQARTNLEAQKSTAEPKIFVYLYCVKSYKKLPALSFATADLPFSNPPSHWCK